MSSATHEPELFDSTEYEIPFTPKTAERTDELVVRLNGGIKLNRNDPAHTSLVEALELGQFVQLAVTASVDGTAHSRRTDSDDTEKITYVVALKAHTITLEQT